MQYPAPIQGNYNDFGLDVTLLLSKLRLTPTERLIEHQAFMDQLDELQKAKIIKTHDKFQRPATTTQPKQS